MTTEAPKSKKTADEVMKGIDEAKGEIGEIKATLAELNTAQSQDIAEESKLLSLSIPPLDGEQRRKGWWQRKEGNKPPSETRAPDPAPRDIAAVRAELKNKKTSANRLENKATYPKWSDFDTRERRPHSLASAAVEEHENVDRDEVYKKAAEQLIAYIPEENRPTLEASTWVQGAPKEAREAITAYIKKLIASAEGRFKREPSKAGKTLELLLAAMTVKNDHVQGGMFWGGRKSNAVLAHKAQDYLFGKTDLIYFLHGAEESYAPSQVALRINATTGYTAFLSKLQYSLSQLRETGHLGGLPFTTFRLGGGLDVQAGNLENTPYAIVALNENTTFDLARLFTANDQQDQLRARPEQIMILRQLELQMEMYRNYLHEHLKEFREEWERKKPQLRTEANILQKKKRTPAEEREYGRLRFQLFVLGRAMEEKTIEKTFQTLSQVQHAVRERRLERISFLFREELRSYQLQIATAISTLEKEKGALQASERDAVSRISLWLSKNNAVKKIPLSEVAILYLAARREGALPWKTILDAIPQDDLHSQLIAAISDTSLINRIAEIPAKEFKEAQSSARVLEIQESVRKNADTKSPLISTADFDEAIKRFPVSTQDEEKSYAKAFEISHDAPLPRPSTITASSTEQPSAPAEPKVGPPPKIEGAPLEQKIEPLAIRLTEEEYIRRQLKEIEEAEEIAEILGFQRLLEGK